MKRRADCLAREAAPLRWATQALFVSVAGAMLWLARPASVPAFWTVWLIAIAGCWGLVISLFWRAATRLRAITGRTPLQGTALLLSPLGAIRAVDLLARDLFTASHPLAVSCALSPPDAFQSTARSLFYDVSKDDASSARAAELRAFLDRAGILDAVLSAPPPESDAMGAYCPRCAQQYRQGSQTCTDCAGVPLQALQA